MKIKWLKKANSISIDTDERIELYNFIANRLNKDVDFGEINTDEIYEKIKSENVQKNYVSSTQIVQFYNQIRDEQGSIALIGYKKADGSFRIFIAQINPDNIIGNGVVTDLISMSIKSVMKRDICFISLLPNHDIIFSRDFSSFINTSLTKKYDFVENKLL